MQKLALALMLGLFLGVGPTSRACADDEGDARDRIVKLLKRILSKHHDERDEDRESGRREARRGGDDDDDEKGEEKGHGRREARRGGDDDDDEKGEEKGHGKREARGGDDDDDEKGEEKHHGKHGARGGDDDDDEKGEEKHHGKHGARRGGDDDDDEKGEEKEAGERHESHEGGEKDETHGEAEQSLTLRVVPGALGAGSGFLGVQPEKGEHCVKLVQIVPDSAAARAGLQAGDELTEVNGKKIEEVQDLMSRVSSLKPGTQVHLRVLRHGAFKNVTATLGTRPAEVGESGDEEDDGSKEDGEMKGPEKGDKDEAAEGKAYTDAFGERASDLGPTGTNPYFVLDPGYALELRGEEKGHEHAITITVLDETREIDGVQARVVEEKESVDGNVEEDTRDYFAISKRTNNVYYFGEDVDNYKDGEVVGHSGSWLSGKDGAHYGLMMMGAPLLGARYQEETAPGVGMDRAEVSSLSGKLECPAGSFDGVLEIEETTALEKDEHEVKRYARGVGLLEDEGMKLVKHGRAK